MPKWKDSRISFKNVYVSRRPSAPLPPRRQIDHLAAVGYDVSGHPAYHRVGEDDDDSATGASGAGVLMDGEVVTNAEEELNMSLFDLNIDSVDVTLSLWRWLDGKGLVEDAVVKGVRGVLGVFLSNLSLSIVYMI